MSEASLLGFRYLPPLFSILGRCARMIAKVEGGEDLLGVQ